MASQRSVVFAEPVRTAIGTFGGSLKDVPAPNLGAIAIGAAVEVLPLERIAPRLVSLLQADAARAGLPG